MILRLWHGVVKSGDAKEYIEYQEEVGPPGYREVEGHMETYMLGREFGENYEVSMLTFWESWEAVRAFAGEPIDRAKYYDRDFDYLIDPPRTVQHYDVLKVGNLKRDTQGSRRSSILRLWRGRTPVEQKEEALKWEAEIGIPGYRAIDGNRGIYMLGRTVERQYEIGMLTFWDSWEAIRAFTGCAVDRANYEEYHRLNLDYLDELPKHVEHFQILFSSSDPKPDGKKRSRR